MPPTPSPPLGGDRAFIETGHDPQAFLRFLGEVVQLLEQPGLPLDSP